ncbi:MAG: FkbM family methyltransferase [Pseudomonadales bacterium]|nr:FkbM family methyltransferase [Halioglobus sp.]MCP5128687.1 FkbM family methyltransferase [Pseudomonadales bacterium]
MSVGLGVCHLLWGKPWLPKRLSRSVYKYLARRGSAPDFPFVTDFFGLEYHGNLNNNIDFNIWFYGAFEKPLLFFLRDTLRRLPGERPVFIDVGANVGQHSLFMAAHGARVHAFEPYSPVREKLLLHIERNRLENIEVHPLALGDRNARQTFFAPTGNNMGIGSFDANTVTRGNVSIGQLELVEGDDYFRKRGIDTVDLIKIDVEGFEKPALAGLRATLDRTRPVILCEISYGTALSFSSAVELLRYLPADYQLFTFDKRKADGSKARRRDAHNRISGQYKLIPFECWRTGGQDDVVACPGEKAGLLPRKNMRGPGNDCA